MSIVAFSGFETGDFSEFSSFSGASIVTSVVRSGTYATNLVTGDSVTIDSPNTTDKASCRFYIRGNINNGSTVPLIELLVAGGSVLVAVSMTVSNTLQITTGGTGTSSEFVSIGTQECIEVVATRGTGSDGVIEVWLNGTRVVNDTAATWSSGDGGEWKLLGLGVSLDTFDDIKCLNDAVRPGSSKVESLRPNGLTGGENDFTIVGGPTNKWEAVDDDAIDDATYLEFTASGAANQELDLTTIADVGTINATKTAIRGNRSGGGSTTMSIRSQDSDESPQNSFDVALLSGTFSYFENIDATPPTSQTELDRWQAKLTKGAGGQDMDISEFWLMVDRTPAAAATFQPSDHFHRVYSPLIAQ